MKPLRQHKHVHVPFNKASAPQVMELNGHDVHFVDPLNPQSLALLSKAYEEIYKPAFPIAEERETLSCWIKNLAENDTIIVLAGKDLDTAAPLIKGIGVAYYYTQEDVGLLAYNAIAPAFRNEGLGHVMVEARKHALFKMAQKSGNPLKGVFIECNDPAKVKPEEDSMDPAIRLQIFQKWGAKIMPIDYVQPPLTKKSKKWDKFKLLAYPHPATGEYPTPNGIRGYINGIYKALAKYNGSIPEKDPDYIKIMAQIDALPQKPPVAPKQCPPSP